MTGNKRIQSTEQEALYYTHKEIFLLAAQIFTITCMCMVLLIKSYLKISLFKNRMTYKTRSSSLCSNFWKTCLFTKLLARWQYKRKL